MIDPDKASARSKKAAATRLARYGPDTFKKLGRKGGRRSSGNRELVDITPYEPLSKEKKDERNKK